MKKISILFKKLLRFLKITKPIKLDKHEIQFIKFCKGHYINKYRTNASNWVESLKPLFEEIYGYSVTENYGTYLNCLVKLLIDIWVKIQKDNSGSNLNLREIIYASFDRSYRRDYEKPIERVIAELCGQIQNNVVIENGIPRYYLEDGKTKSITITLSIPKPKGWIKKV